MAPAERPGEIQWKMFLRTAWPIAAFAGVIACFFPKAGLLILLPASVFLAIRLYLKRRAVPLRAGQGAKLGMVMGLISFISFASLSVIAIVSSADVRQELVKAVNLAASRNPDPQTQQILRDLVNSPQGFALMIAMGFGFLMVIFLVFTAISGAVAASTLGSKNP